MTKIKLSLGQRVNLDALTLVKHTSYKGKDFKGVEISKHRYVFVSRERDRFVYSGIPLGIVLGHAYNVRATVKRFEPEYDCVRLSRVSVVGEWEEERLLL